MKHPIAVLCALVALVMAWPSQGAESWQAGKHYIVVSPAQRTSLPPGKIEVAEIFSYGCPYCSQAQPEVEKLKASLPANAELVYVPASFIPREAWPMYQRAFYAAQALGIEKKTHSAMYDAVWKTGELSYTDAATRRIKSPLPTIEDAARFYAKVGGVTAKQFLDAANSFSVDVKMRAADAFIGATQSLSTPTFVVNGKYRLDPSMAGGYPKLIELVDYLVKKETAAMKGAAGAKGT